MRLGQKIALNLLFGLALLMSLALFLVFQNFKHKNQIAAEHQISSLLQAQRTQLLQISREWGHLIQVILQDHHLAKWRENATANPLPKAGTSSLFQSVIHSQHGVVRSLFLLDTKGNKLLQVGEAGLAVEQFPFLEFELHFPALEPQGSTFTPQIIFPIDFKSSEPLMLYMVPLYRQGKLHAVFAVGFSLDILDALLRGFIIENIEDGYLLSNENGAALTQYFSKQEFTHSALKKARNNGLQDRAPTLMVVQSSDELGQIVGWIKIPELGLELYSVVDEASTWENASQTFIVVFLILVLAGIVGSTLIILMIDRLLARPLQRLIQVVEASEDQLQLPSSELTDRGDEFGALARAFSKMQLRIWERIASLRSLHWQFYFWMEQTDPSILLQLTLMTLQERFESSTTAYYIFTEEGFVEQRGVAPESSKEVMPNRLQNLEFWKGQDRVSLVLIEDTPLVSYPEAIGSVLVIPLKQRQEESGIILCYLDGIVDELPAEELAYIENLAQMMQVVRDNLLLLEKIKGYSNTLETEVEARTQELADINQGLETKVKKEVQTRLDQDKILIQQSKMAEMGEMLSLIAHQWRQPLGVIGGLIANLDVKLQLSQVPREVIQESLLKLNEQAQFLAQTINDFRNFLKPSTEAKRCNLEHPIKNSIKILELSLSEGLVILCLDLNSEKEIKTYPNAITQVLVVLVKNCLDAFRDNKISHPELMVRLYSEEGGVVIEVQDNAGGIPQVVLDNIFTPYQTTKENGTGLGLYMCQTIIERHCQGRITVANHAKGACFKLFFPDKVF